MKAEKLQFNFTRRWEEHCAKAHQEKRKKNKILALGGVALVFLGLIGSTPWIWEYKLRLDLEKVNLQISELSLIDQEVKRLKTLNDLIEQQKQVLRLSSSTRDPNVVLGKLKDILPGGTRVNSLALNPENLIVISVTVPSPVDVAKLWMSLRDSNLFEKVDIQTVSLLDQAQTLNLSLIMKQ